MTLHPAPAKAASTPPAPPAGNSMFIGYISDTTNFTDLQTLGQNEATLENQNSPSHSCSGGTNPFVIVLDLGDPWETSSGSPAIRDFSYQTLTFAQVLTASEKFALGWYQNSWCWQRLSLVVGTNNSYECGNWSGSQQQSCLYQDGRQLADTTHQLQQYLVNSTYSWQITAAAGDDIEAEWDTPAITNQFVNAFNSYPNYEPLYDYGDANYPQSSWSEADIYQVAWGDAYDLSIPEVYTGYDTQNFNQVVSTYSSSGMFYSGVMTESLNTTPYYPWESDATYGYSPTPDQEWPNPYTVTPLYQAQTPVWLTNIYWYN